MTSRWRKILLGMAACLLLILAVHWLQRRALLQEFTFGQIAYASNGERASKINLMDVNGVHLATVRSVVDPSYVCCPVWSPNGEQLAYAVTDYDSACLGTALDSINFLNLTNGQEIDVNYQDKGEYGCTMRDIRNLELSDDGKCFRWITNGSTNFYMITRPATNTINEQAESSCWQYILPLYKYTIGFNRELTYSPDGHYYLEAVYQRRSNKFESYLVSTDGMSVSLGLGFITAFAWSPDAQQFVFTKTNPNESTNEALYLVHIADLVPQPLVTDVDVNRDPTWSPDSRWVAFSAAGPDGNVDIYKVNAETEEVTRLTTDATVDTNPVWRPAP
jgi:Tol biopolymer transport system component